MPRARRRTALSVVFYATVTAVLAGILTGLFPLFLPDALADRISHNSEGLLLALIIAAWIQFVRPRLTGTEHEWAITGLTAGLCLAVGLYLFLSDLPSPVRTLNEPMLAAALLVPYVQARRPLPGRTALSVVLALLTVTVVFNRTAIVTSMAEMLVALILVPAALDLVDRGILDPEAESSRRARYGWYAFLVLAPVTSSLLYYEVGVDGLLGEGLHYAGRAAEVFVTLLLVELYAAAMRSRPVGQQLSGPRREPVPAI
jgi:hypothetical protein